NRSLETAASTVIQGSSPDKTVAEGSIQARWAWAESGRQMARARAVHLIMGFMQGFLWSLSQFEGDAAQFAFALGLLFLGFLRRPAEGQAQQFTPAHFAGGFHHQAIFAGRQVLERRLAVIEHQAVAADRAGRAADAVHRHLEAA